MNPLTNPLSPFSPLNPLSPLRQTQGNETTEHVTDASLPPSEIYQEDEFPIFLLLVPAVFIVLLLRIIFK